MAYQSPFHTGRTPPPDEATRARMRAGLERNIAESQAKGYMRADFNDLLKPLNREAKKTAGNKLAEQMSEKKKKPTRGEIKKALANGATLDVSTPSDCFESLSAVDAGDGMVLVTGTFRNPTHGDWDYLMPLGDFLDWANDDLGVAFNEWVRGNYEA
jgi:hypothetical protein